MIKRVIGEHTVILQYLAVYEGKDVIICAPTGAGKTLSFWIPLLVALKDGLDPMVIVVTPLNLLGK